VAKGYVQLPAFFSIDEVQDLVPYDEARLDRSRQVVELYAMVRIGGVDEEGIFEYVLDDGPAQGERVYVKYHE